MTWKCSVCKDIVEEYESGNEVIYNHDCGCLKEDGDGTMMCRCKFEEDFA